MMSANPLFSGLGQPPRQFAQNHSSGHSRGGEASKAFKHSPLGKNTMESSLPRKKPRLNSGGNTITETDNGDDPFGDFEDSFTADDFDVIDMIATQALSQAPASNVNHFQKENALPNSSSSQFQPKKLNNLSSLHGVSASSNAYKKMPFTSSSLPSHGASSLPNKANMTVPFHQHGNRGIKLPPSPSGNNFLKKRTTVGGGGDVNARNQLTPPKGSTVPGQQSLPPGAQDESSEIHQIQQQLERFKAETERLNQQLAYMKTEKCRKDGEIEVLRQNLTKAQTDVSKLQMERIERDDQKQREQAAREKELQKQVETLKTQLDFKEREILEAQTSFRNLQQRMGQGGTQHETSCSSPRKSPRLVQVNSPSRPAFPSKLSFMVGGSKQVPGSPKLKSESPQKNKLGKTKTPGCKVSPGSSSPSLGVTKILPNYEAAAQTKTRYRRGCISPSQLVGKLMDGASRNGSDGTTSLMSVFNSPSQLPESNGNTDAELELHQSRMSRQLLASQSISLLLNPPCDAVEYHPRPLSGYLAMSCTPSAADTHLAELLPLIQEQLDHYVRDLEALAASLHRPMNDISERLESDLVNEEEHVVVLRGQALVQGLQILSRLCSFSEPVCSVIRAGCQRMQEGMVTSAKELDPSAPIISTQTGSRTSSSVLSCVLSQPRVPCRIIQLLQSLLSFRPVRGHPHNVLVSGGWRVVSTLARNVPETQEINWCLPFLLQDSLGVALSSDSSLTTKISVVITMAAVARQHLICTQSDSCPLLHVYQLGTVMDKATTEDDMILLRIEILHLLLVVVSCEASGISSLVETNCQCSFEVISSIVSMMFSELKLAETKQTSQRLYMLQQGLFLLHMMQNQTKALHELKIETEMELMLLVVTLHKLMKKSSKAGRYLGVLQDLWDCVAGDDDVWDEEEDMQE